MVRIHSTGTKDSLQEEEEFKKSNPFLEQEKMEEPLNTSVLSGISDKSILLR